MNRVGLVFALFSIWAQDSLGEPGLIFYYGPSFSDSQYYSLQNASLLPDHPKFIYEETHIYIHGFGESQQGANVLTTVDAYLNSAREINLVAVDYSELVAGNYISAVLNMLQFAPILAKTMLELFAGNLVRDNVTVVGHSLGAQLAGYTGREIKSQSNDTVSLRRIWGIDPAFPGFLPQNLLPTLQTLNRNDGDFVSIIHTGAPTYGTLFPTGDVDFYVNGGVKFQPGCPVGIFLPLTPEDMCSHHRSWKFWAESVRYQDEIKFCARPALNYDDFLSTEFSQNDLIIMGPECPETARGLYFLKTNPSPRYAQGSRC